MKDKLDENKNELEQNKERLKREKGNNAAIEQDIFNKQRELTKIRERRTL